MTIFILYEIKLNAFIKRELFSTGPLQWFIMFFNVFKYAYFIQGCTRASFLDFQIPNRFKILHYLILRELKKIYVRLNKHWFSLWDGFSIYILKLWCTQNTSSFFDRPGTFLFSTIPLRVSMCCMYVCMYVRSCLCMFVLFVNHLRQTLMVNTVYVCINYDWMLFSNNNNKIEIKTPWRSVIMSKINRPKNHIIFLQPNTGSPVGYLGST